MPSEQEEQGNADTNAAQSPEQPETDASARRSATLNGQTNRAGRSRGNGNGGNGLRNRRGLSNGNGMVNGAGSGRARRRGLTNGTGISNGNGLVNGTRTGPTSGARKGNVNGRGMINGNGFTNGRKMAHEEAAPKPNRRLGWIAAGVAAILLGAVLLSAFVLLTGEKGIQVDGEFSDWSGTYKYPDGSADAPIPESDLEATALVVDDSSVSFYVKMEGKALEGQNNGMDSVYFFIDADQDPATGYAIDSVGAEYVLIVDGYKGDVTAAGFYRFSVVAGKPSNDWNGRTSAGSARAMVAGKELEAQIPRSDLQLTGDRLNAVVISRDGAGAEDTGPVMGTDGAALQASWRPVGPAAVTPGSGGVSMLAIDLTALRGPVTVSELRIRVNNGTEVTDLSKLAVNTSSGELTGTMGPLSGGSCVFTPGTPIRVAKGQTVALTVNAWFPAGARSGRAVGLALQSSKDIVANTKAVTLGTAALGLSYIGGPSRQIQIDGAFSDWERIPSHPDPKDDVQVADIDLTDFRVTNDSATFFLYAQVDGQMMAGSGIPEGKLRPAGGGGGGGGGAVQLPVLVGEDAFYVFIDTDFSVATGYNGGGLPIGADYMVKITGQYGRLLEKIVAKFTGGVERGRWSWSDGTAVSAAADATRLEGGVPLAALGSPLGNLSLYYYTTDWKGWKDSGQRLAYDLRAGGSGRGGSGGTDVPEGTGQAPGEAQTDPLLHAPEFSELAVPMAAVTGLFMVVRRRFGRRR